MIEETNGSKISSSLEPPTTNDSAAWSAYWKACDQKWRTEPEIDKDRQRTLRGYLRTIPDDDPDIYPFHLVKLTRADVEWLIVNPPVDTEKLLESAREIINKKRHEGTIDLQTLIHFRSELYHQAIDTQTLDLRGADLQCVNLSGLYLSRARLEFANLERATLTKAFLDHAHLEYADLGGACLRHASLSEANLEKARLIGASLEKTDLRGSHLEGTDLGDAHMEGAVLAGAFFDSTTNLDGVSLSSKEYGSALLDNVHWDGVDLSGIAWEQLKVLGDEQRIAQLTKRFEHQIKNNYEREKYREFLQEIRKTRIRQFRRAAAAYRRLAIALQEQELMEEASYFAYRAKVLQRTILWKERKIGYFIFSLLLDLLSGYGYRFRRSFIAYALIIALFTALYHILAPQLAWNEAFVVSMTALHGRGFFPGAFSPGDPLAIVSAFEAFVGLIIEVTFIATLTQRLFGK